MNTCKFVLFDITSYKLRGTKKSLLRLASEEMQSPLIDLENEIVKMDVARQGVEKGVERERGRRFFR